MKLEASTLSFNWSWMINPLHQIENLITCIRSWSREATEGRTSTAIAQQRKLVKKRVYGHGQCFRACGCFSFREFRFFHCLFFLFASRPTSTNSLCNLLIHVIMFEAQTRLKNPKNYQTTSELGRRSSLIISVRKVFKLLLMDSATNEALIEIWDDNDGSREPLKDFLTLCLENTHPIFTKNLLFTWRSEMRLQHLRRCLQTGDRRSRIVVQQPQRRWQRTEQWSTSFWTCRFSV